MKYSLNITDTAKSDLREIAIYIAEQSQSKDVALKFLDELLACCNRLIDFPQSGAYPKDYVLKNLGYRYLVHGDYLVFYTLDDNAYIANIVAIFNSKKDYMRVLKTLI